MKIKYLAIALLSSTLLVSPLLAKDKVKPVKTIKEMDKASPANLSIQTSTDKLEIAKKKAESELHKETTTQGSNPLHKSVEGMSSETEVVENQSDASTKAREKGSGMATGKRTYEPVTESQSASNDVYIKIDDIKGETSKAADEVKPDRIEFKKAAAVPANHNTTRSNKTIPGNDTSNDGNKAVSATDYNSSRSNKADGIAADTDSSGDADEDQATKATDYNSSRSNKSFAADLDADGEDNDCDAKTEKKVCTTTGDQILCQCTHL